VTAVVETTWRVGDKIGPLVAGPVTRTGIALFAGGSGDHNEVHLDPRVARAAGMQDVFAQGMLSMAYLGRLLTDTFGQAALLSFGSRFTAITPADAKPTCRGEITAITDGIATVDLFVTLADGTLTLAGSATVALARAAGATS
jgi:acyl dehydratase